MEWYVLVLMLSLPPSIHADLCSKQCQKCAQQILNSEVDLSSLVRRDAARKKNLLLLLLLLCFVMSYFFILKNSDACVKPANLYYFMSKYFEQ